jgi:hypothetical protein
MAEKSLHHGESSEESEDENNIGNQLDQDRLCAIKDILFDICRENTGEEILSIPSFIDFILESTRNAQDTFSSALF